MSLRDKLIVALDLPGVDDAEALTRRCGDAVSFYKIGLQLLPVGGMDLNERLRAAGKKVFLDFKLHDIPATVEKATRSIASRGGDLLTVHAEPAVMRAAVAGRGDDPDLKLLGVTVLTAYDDAMLTEMGYAFGTRDLVMRRVEQALDCGMDGVVASPLEAAEIRERFGGGFLIVTPGIRPAGADAGDQKRVATPGDALKAGSTHLVVGRPVNAAEDPAEAARDIIAEMEAV
ncbi:orotidine-5'-phosphate decarboxylase [Hyphobacterium sp. HN65]|uniref:Orotidine 5'-phosphate decarboxylase n=1 Tax=Hyphobacterium lacteum TaxID=3116575 RepID=A0ABU7LRK5_9PROT|nr:orotidine-5'-phosphate decarboxylase [Hyphobacterium sp. HN65]MEE2526548.1 orotidine-5'-phosphate decarboxylase [Hyphobacterium sp. HN65]